MVSLRTKNPFASGVEIFSWKTAVGVSAFAVLAGVAVAGIKYVSGKAESMNPIEDLYSRLDGLGG